VKAILDAIQPFPRICVWETTARCNLSCIHCASNLGPSSTRGPELDGERSLRLCDELAELGCEYLVLSGGEPLLRSDWDQLAARLSGNGVRVGMITNGFLVTADSVERMARAGVSVLAVSMDGLQETHDRIRQRPGSFDRAVRALELGRQAGLRIHAVTHVNRLNRGDLTGMHALFERLEVRTWLVQLSAPMGRLAAHRDLVLEPTDLPELARWLADTRERSRLYLAVGDNIGYYTELEPRLRRKREGKSLGAWCGCSAGCFTVGIEANGNVKGCLSLQSDQFVEGNLTDRSLRSVWESPTAFRYTRGFEPAMLTGHCADCEYGEVCRGGCTFMAVASTGSPGNNPYCLHRLGLSQ
jgi:radical SAM protein with 4Fe4S-binding SPASM domain